MTRTRARVRQYLPEKLNNRNGFLKVQPGYYSNVCTRASRDSALRTNISSALSLLRV